MGNHVDLVVLPPIAIMLVWRGGIGVDLLASWVYSDLEGYRQMQLVRLNGGLRMLRKREGSSLCRIEGSGV